MVSAQAVVVVSFVRRVNEEKVDINWPMIIQPLKEQLTHPSLLL